MAKQNVTFVERHLEKFVIGICGVTLLAVVALFLLDTPNKVEVEGQSLAPKEFYRMVEEQAVQVASRMKNAQPSPDQAPEGITNISQNPSPYTTAGLPTQFNNVFVALSPPVPNIPDLDGEKQKVELAEIVAPVRPVLTTGRSTGKLPESEQIEIAATSIPPSRRSDDSLDATKEYIWATVVTAINRQEQRELFELNGYTSARLALKVADVQAEREELLPNGQWGEPEIVHSYSPTVNIPSTTVRIIQEDGEFIVPPDQMSLIEAHHHKFGSDLQQAEVLRPDFVTFLDKQWKWSVKELPGVELYWEDFAVEPVKEDKDSRPGRRRPAAAEGPARNRPAAAGATADDSLLREMIETLKEAEKAIAEKKYLDAEELLLPLKAHTESNTPGVAVQAKKAQEKLESIATEIEDARIAEAQRQRRKEEAAKLNFGPDIDLAWINDISVTPGKTYRYRVRIIALNQYAGLPAELKNPEDAAQLTRAGKWSDWSDPIAVEPEKYLFFNGLDGEIAKIEVWQSVSGKWKSSTSRLEVGQPVTIGTGRSSTNYGIIVDIDPNRNYRSQKEVSETPALVLVNARGEVEEHLVLEDKTRKTDFMTKKKTDEERENSDEAAATPRRPPPRPTRLQPGSPRGANRDPLGGS